MTSSDSPVTGAQKMSIHPLSGLIKSRQRVADHGEVFTPAWLVEAMLDLVKSESERIDARFLEPACGSGNFLIPVLRRKLASVQFKYGKSDFEKRHYALFALMCIYGIELLTDNAEECRTNLLRTFAEYLLVDEGDEWYQAALTVVEANIVQADALNMTTAAGDPITFAEWSYTGRGKYQRRDFRFDTLTQMSSFSREGTLFAELGKHELFAPIRDHGSLSIADIAAEGSLP